MDSPYLRRETHFGYSEAELRAMSPDAIKQAIDRHLDRAGSPSASDKQVALRGRSYVVQLLGKPGTPEARRMSALELFGRGVIAELKPILKRWVLKADPSVRPALARHLAAFGTVDLLPEMKKLLTDSTTYVAASARGGALEAVKAGRAEGKFKTSLFAHAEEHAAEMQPGPDAWDTTELLRAINPDLAKSALSRPKVLRLDHPALHDIIHALVDLNAPPPVEFLMNALKKAPNLIGSRAERLEEAALAGMMLNDHPRSGELAEQILRSKRPQKHERRLLLLAWERRFRAKGLTLPYEEAIRAWTSSKRANFAKFPPTQQKFILLHEFDAAMHSGETFAAWFWHPLASQTSNLLSTLQGQGATQHAKAVSSALEILGDVRLLGNRSQLKARMDRFSEKEWDQLDSLAVGWCSASWKVAILAFEWKKTPTLSKSKTGPAPKPHTATKALSRQLLPALRQLAEEFQVSLPKAYLEFMSEYPSALSRPGGDFDEPPSDLHILKSPARIRDLNREVRDMGNVFAGNKPWPASYFIIGHDGCGNYYALDTQSARGKIVMFDHEERDFENTAADIRKFEQLIRDLFDLPVVKT